MTSLKARILKWGLVLLVAIGLTYAVLEVFLARSVSQAYLDLEASGRPMKPEDLVPSKIPDSQNAAISFQEAILVLKSGAVPDKDQVVQLQEASQDSNLFKRLDELSSSAACWDPSLPPDEEAQKKALEALPELRIAMQNVEVQQALSKVEEGVGRPGLNYDLDYSQGAEMTLSHLADLRGLTRILVGKAKVQTENRDFQAAWHTLITSFRMADILKQEPLLISQLVRVAQFRITCHALYDLCKTSPPSETDRATLTELLKRFEDTQPFVTAMDGERLFLGEYGFKLKPKELSRVVKAKVLVRQVIEADHAAALRAYLELVRIMEGPYISEQEVENRVMSNVPKICFLTRALIPALGKVKTNMVRMQAESRMARVGLAILDHRQRQGQYPASLKELGTEIPMDPFTQALLHYVPSETGFLLYSEGPNQKDDKGQGKPNPSEQELDIFWRHTQAVPSS